MKSNIRRKEITTVMEELKRKILAKRCKDKEIYRA